MKKYFLSCSFLLLSILVFAQDKDSKAYKIGYALGQAAGIILIAVLIFFLIKKLRGKR